MEKIIYGIIFFSRKPRYNKLQLRINTTSNPLKQIRKCNNATVFSFSSIYPAPTCNQGYVEGYSKMMVECVTKITLPVYNRIVLIIFIFL